MCRVGYATAEAYWMFWLASAPGWLGSYSPPLICTMVSESHVFCIGAIFGHESLQIRLTRVLFQKAHNILVRRGGHICERLVQPAQVRRRHLITIAARQHCPEPSRRLLRLHRCCSDRALTYYLPLRVRGCEVCCRHDGLHASVQHHG